MICKLFLLLFSALVEHTFGHGRLMDPPARNSMWRFGYENPVNYNDNELYCGGYVVHYQRNAGKCGICGDDYREKKPRPHEAGGIYSNGYVVKRYVVGQEMVVEAELTTNHYGHMVIELCPHNDANKDPTEECFQQYPLEVKGTNSTIFVIPEGTQKTEIFRWTVLLPEDVSCSHCVLRWKYFTGNTWGTCPDGTESVGCGVQETFINCADIAILTNTPQLHHDDFNPWLLYYKNDLLVSAPLLRLGLRPVFSDLKPLVVRAQVCLPTEAFRNVEGMMDWCRTHCLAHPPNCPPKFCKCVYECSAVGEFALRKDADIWCHQNCLKGDPFCPAQRCSCT